MSIHMRYVYEKRQVAAKWRIETMEENRARLISAARKAFAEKGFAAASMDQLTTDAGLRAVRSPRFLDVVAAHFARLH